MSPTVRRLGWPMGFAVAAILLPLDPHLSAQPDLAASSPARTKTMTQRATGTFQVRMQPLASAQDGQPDFARMGRMSLDKTYEGDLVATAKGEMLTVGTAVKGSAVYVAVETVNGVLHGRKGSFALHHKGVMTRGEGELSVQIVPDSGTGELAGIHGHLAIKVEGGRHQYEIEYGLAEG